MADEHKAKRLEIAHVLFMDIVGYTAADYFQRAIAVDPQYAAAYAGLAQTYAVIPLFAAGMPRDYFPKGKAAAQRAIELDETSAEAHTALAEKIVPAREFHASSK